jgi:Gas vesicle protein
MARLRKPAKQRDWLFPNAVASHEAEDESSLLDVLDNVLNRGAVLAGEVVLGVADVDLIYVKLSVLLAAFDKVTKNDPVLKAVAAGPRTSKTRTTKTRTTKTRRHEATKRKSSR